MAAQTGSDHRDKGAVRSEAQRQERRTRFLREKCFFANAASRTPFPRLLTRAATDRVADIGQKIKKANGPWGRWPPVTPVSEFNSELP
jgi:hypothetical protein